LKSRIIRLFPKGGKRNNKKRCNAGWLAGWSDESETLWLTHLLIMPDRSLYDEFEMQKATFTRKHQFFSSLVSVLYQISFAFLRPIHPASSVLVFLSFLLMEHLKSEASIINVADEEKGQESL
jgi:hypothetical protein